MREAIAAFFAEHPECRLRALGARDNAPALDLAPFGQPVEYLDAAARPSVGRALPRRQPRALPRRARAARLGPRGSLPAARRDWPPHLPRAPLRGAPGRPRGRGRGHRRRLLRRAQHRPRRGRRRVADLAPPEDRRGLDHQVAHPEDAPRHDAARIAQWDNASLRVHTRMGALRLARARPERARDSRGGFHYAVDLADEGRWREAMTRPRTPPEDTLPGAAWLPVADGRALRALLDRAASGERIEILPPGLSSDGARVLVRCR